MITLLAHGDELLQRGNDDYIGSPMYSILAEHEFAILAVFGLFAFGWLIRRSERERFARWVNSYRALGVLDRTLFWLLGITATVHGALVLTHEPSGYTALYLADAALLGFAARRLMTGRPWRLWTGLALIGSLLGYAVSGMAGEPPDQVGLATKLVELGALAIVLTPQTDRRRRRVLASSSVVGLTVIVAIGAWVGAFQSGDGGHHLGDTPTPGVLLPNGEDREPTANETAEADRIYREVQEAIAPFDDPTVAAAAGYNVEGMYGTSFHASNSAYQADDHFFDPQRPETLVYAVGSGGPVLLGAMFEMGETRVAGPTPGGPLTVWHAHDHVCFSLTPPALAGFVSPLGGCPFGSIAIAMTGEMLHVWTLPGVDEPFGDIDETWLNEYLASGA
jgi:hypothetical protein